jgi:hypothetical protein
LAYSPASEIPGADPHLGFSSPLNSDNGLGWSASVLSVLPLNDVRVDLALCHRAGNSRSVRTERSRNRQTTFTG